MIFLLVIDVFQLTVAFNPGIVRLMRLTRVISRFVRFYRLVGGNKALPDEFVMLENTLVESVFQKECWGHVMYFLLCCSDNEHSLLVHMMCEFCFGTDRVDLEAMGYAGINVVSTSGAKSVFSENSVGIYNDNESDYRSAELEAVDSNDEDSGEFEWGTIHRSPTLESATVMTNPVALEIDGVARENDSQDNVLSKEQEMDIYDKL